MNPRITQIILEDHQLGYLIVDRNFKSIQIKDPLSLYPDDPQWLQQASMWELMPELVGNEDVLTDLMAGTLPRYQLDMINRETVRGDQIYITVAILPYQEQDGHIVGLICLFEDTTKIGKLHQQLTQQYNEAQLLQRQLVEQKMELAAANTELQHLADLKSTFVSIAAHELRTPLAAISGYVELLLDEDEPLTNTQHSYLKIVNRSAERLLKITQNLLQITQIETGRVELVLRPNRLDVLMNGVIIELRTLLEAKSQQLTVEIEPDLPLVLCDESRTVQILSNLISNAIKYTQQAGHIQIKLAVANDREHLLFSIKDDGIGISAEEQTTLFKPFVRASNSNAMGATGTGLGLYITRSLVELHGGQIWLESKLHQGTTVFVMLPLADK